MTRTSVYALLLPGARRVAVPTLRVVSWAYDTGLWRGLKDLGLMRGMNIHAIERCCARSGAEEMEWRALKTTWRSACERLHRPGHFMTV